MGRESDENKRGDSYNQKMRQPNFTNQMKKIVLQKRIFDASRIRTHYIF